MLSGSCNNRGFNNHSDVKKFWLWKISRKYGNTNSSSIWSIKTMVKYITSIVCGNWTTLLKNAQWMWWFHSSTLIAILFMSWIIYVHQESHAFHNKECHKHISCYWCQLQLFLVQKPYSLKVVVLVLLASKFTHYYYFHLGTRKHWFIIGVFRTRDESNRDVGW